MNVELVISLSNIPQWHKRSVFSTTAVDTACTFSSDTESCNGWNIWGQDNKFCMETTYFSVQIFKVYGKFI